MSGTMNWSRSKTRSSVSRYLTERPVPKPKAVLEAEKAALKKKPNGVHVDSPPVAAAIAPMPEIKSQTVLITPEMAVQWLEGNTHNRKLRQRDVEDLAHTIKSGHWRLNGESIIFADTGRLMDGQHRLWACVESGVAIPSLVVWGVPESDFTTIDGGSRRTHADHLTVSGVRSNNMNRLAAVAGLIVRYRNNDIFSQVKMDSKDIVELVKSEPDISKWLDEATRAPRGLKNFATPLAATLYLGSAKLPDKASQFVHQWVTGESLAAGSPVLTLRNRVMTNVPSKSWERFFMAVSTWNAFAVDRPLLKMGSLRSDKFPKIEGTE